MRNLNKVWKIGFAFIALTLFMVQSCNEADQNLSPEIDDVLSVKSMDWDSVDPMDVANACKSVCLVAGQHMEVGSIDVAYSGGYLFVTYNLFEPDVYLKEVHLEIFASLEELEEAKKINGGGPNPGKFDYKMTWEEEDMMTNHSVMIPLGDLPDKDCFYIGAHAALSNGETAWGGICNESNKGVSLEGALQFPGNNWAVYFDFCFDNCGTVFTYAWEDINEDIYDQIENDADYNDLVIVQTYNETPYKVTISFEGKARGAGFEHAFKIKIPKTGIEGISGNDGAVMDDGTYYYIPVFSNTRDVLPGWNDTNHANTLPDDNDCDDDAFAVIELEINNDFVRGTPYPYEPFITVNPESINKYDLYVYEISGIDFWTRTMEVEGEEVVLKYPNGIIIPDNWKWPLEKQIITGPYPDFMDLDNWNLNWADNLADESLVWECSE